MLAQVFHGQDAQVRHGVRCHREHRIDADRVIGALRKDGAKPFDSLLQSLALLLLRRLRGLGGFLGRLARGCRRGLLLRRVFHGHVPGDRSVEFLQKPRCRLRVGEGDQAFARGCPHFVSVVGRADHGVERLRLWGRSSGRRAAARTSPFGSARFHREHLRRSPRDRAEAFQQRTLTFSLPSSMALGQISLPRFASMLQIARILRASGTCL